MKKLLFLLLVVLPFQFAWAAAGAVCVHQADAPSHFGHHAKLVKQNGSDPRDGESFPSDGDDCQTCGAHSLKIVAPSTGLPDATTGGSDFVLTSRVSSLLPPERPERPKWRTPG